MKKIRRTIIINETSKKLSKQFKWIQKNTKYNTNEKITNFINENIKYEKIKNKYNLNRSKKTVHGWINMSFNFNQELIPYLKKIIDIIMNKEKTLKNKKNKINSFKNIIHSFTCSI